MANVVVERPSSYAATHKRVAPRGGGWAVTLKSAAARGLPISLADPAYITPFIYLTGEQIVAVKGRDLGYHDAVHARYRQTGT
jgi:hypothetical protein